MNKKIVIFLSLLMFTLNIPFSVFANGVALPDYRTEAKKYNLRLCDAKTTKITFYRNQAAYYVTEAETKSGDVFLMFFDTAGGSAHFLLKSAGAKTVELTREEWYGKLQTVAPNYFRSIRGGPADCFEAIRYPQNEN